MSDISDITSKRRRHAATGNNQLLTEPELQSLYQRARSASSDSSLQNLLEQHQAGDVASRYRGAGLDYAESRKAMADWICPPCNGTGLTLPAEGWNRCGIRRLSRGY